MAVRFFGSFQVTLNTQPHSATLKTDKSRALFAYLLIENDHPHRRAKLIDLFWSGFSDKAAHNSLRQSLYYIRNLSADLNPSALNFLTSINDVQLIPQAGLWVDTFELTSLLGRCEAHHKTGDLLCDTCLESLTLAVGLYSGDFMDGFSLRDTSQFDWWLLNKKETYNRMVLKALGWITNSLMLKNDYAQAISFAQREIELCPWGEPAHQRYMKALALAGERGKALHHFELCQHILANEAGIEPSQETRCLCEQIRKDTLQKPSLEPEPFNRHAL